MIPIVDILARLKGVKPAGRGYAALCPAHDDRNPSLSISEGEDGKILVHCHHGCAPADIAAAIGVELKDLFPDDSPAPRGKKPAFKIVATYDYTDADGALLYQVVRMEPKDFRQRRKHPDGEHWIWGITKGKYYQGRNGDWRPCPREYEGEYTTFPAVPPTIYHLPRIIKAASSNRSIVIVEGVKDADNLIRLGSRHLQHGGAGKFHCTTRNRAAFRDAYRHHALQRCARPQHAEQVLSLLAA